jgi:hypothetical protein
MVWQRTFRHDPRGLIFGTLFRIAGRPIIGRYARQAIANLEELERAAVRSRAHEPCYRRPAHASALRVTIQAAVPPLRSTGSGWRCDARTARRGGCARAPGQGPVAGLRAPGIRRGQGTAHRAGSIPASTPRRPAAGGKF